MGYYTFTTNGRNTLGLGARGQNIELKVTLEDADGKWWAQPVHQWTRIWHSGAAEEWGVIAELLGIVAVALGVILAVMKVCVTAKPGVRRWVVSQYLIASHLKRRRRAILFLRLMSEDYRLRRVHFLGAFSGGRWGMEKLTLEDKNLMRKARRRAVNRKRRQSNVLQTWGKRVLEK